MCGIAGIIQRDGTSVDRAALSAMVQAVVHRGPDDGDMWSEGGVGLGHRRLAILDLSSAGRQPMADSSGRYRLTYNGEIYNYLELRADLEGRGHRFQTATDTEVLLAAYAEWGEACLSRLNGMWAFALWDRQRGRLFCARDRFGIKPLFFVADARGRFLLASEIKQLLAAGVGARANRRRLAEFIADSHTEHDADTFFSGIRRLRPAHHLVLDSKGLRIRRWWTPPPPPTNPWAPPAPEAPERVLELLTDAVRLRLRSDVMVGTCLSGGVDSNAVACLIGDRLRGDLGASSGRLQCFTALHDDPALDETRYIEAGRARSGAEWHTVMCAGENVVDGMWRVLRAHDEPYISTGTISQFLVLELAREHGVTVLLNGQGSDEIFCGYRSFQAPLLADMLAGGRAADALRLTRAHGLSGSLVRAVAAELTHRSWLDGHLLGLAGALRRRRRRAALTSDTLRLLPDPPSRQAAGSALHAAQRSALARFALPAYLRNEDRNGMAHARESRLPFLDYRLVEFALGLPVSSKLRGGLGKVVLRDAMRRIVPDIILDRRDKMGFPSPQARWLRSELRDPVRAATTPAALRAHGLYDVPDAVARCRQFEAGDDRLSPWVWRVTITHHWAEQHGI